MDIELLTDENFKYFAFSHYNNPQCVDLEEFQKDLTKFKYIQKCLSRYSKTGKISIRLMLNYLITTSNLFGVEASMKMLKFKIRDEFHPSLKPFLVYLGYCAQDDMVDVRMDRQVVDLLREFRKTT